MSGPLSHLTVLDLSRVLAGPWCTQLLADLGATVIKIERPGSGDDTRAWGPPYLKDAHGQRHERGRVLPRRAIAASSRSPSTSRRPTGSAIVRDLARQADVLVENYKVGGLAKYGLDYASRRRARIRGSSTRRSPASGRTARTPTAPATISSSRACRGFMSVTGERDDLPGGGPQKAGIAITDLMTGMYATVAIQAALAHRDRTGQGQWIDTCLFDSAVAMMAVMNMNYLVDRQAAGARRQRAPEHRARTRCSPAPTAT